jgi:glycosyltransferase involved in cell wall biosynthesis
MFESRRPSINPPVRQAERPPRVSIGLPVYNGENFLAGAIESILAQTFTDFELIICDNASTDRTAEICHRYAAPDRRVKYHRNERNLGAGPNFARAFELSSGEYFRWACHDDLLAPTYLEKCVAVLDRNPDVVLCHTQTRVISDHGEGMYQDLVGLDADRPSDRFAAVALRLHWCMDIHGLMRAEVLRRTGLIGGYFGADRALLAELALAGRFARVEEPLFINRDHPERSMRALSFLDRLKFHDPTKGGRRILPSWALYTDYFRIIPRHVSEPGERRRCYLRLLQWWFVNWHAARVAVDVMCLIAPSISVAAFRMRQRYRRGALGARQT